MIRNASRRRVMFAVVFALVGLLAVPIDECDDYGFFLPGAALAQAESTADGPVDANHQHICSCVVCALTTDDVFVPCLSAPQLGGTVAAVPSVFLSSTFLPGIFRPPIA